MAAMGPTAPAADVVSDYVESSMGDRFGEAVRYVRSYPEQLRLLADLLPRIFTPVQIITGRWDPLVPLANAEHLHARLPNSRLDVLDTGHFVWEEAPDQYGAIVAAWVTGRYLAGSGGLQD
jgi:pimeloyl-ACP methyl ester carboxylesterase